MKDVIDELNKHEMVLFGVFILTIALGIALAVSYFVVDIFDMITVVIDAMFIVLIYCSWRMHVLEKRIREA